MMVIIDEILQCGIRYYRCIIFFFVAEEKGFDHERVYTHIYISLRENK